MAKRKIFGIAFRSAFVAVLASRFLTAAANRAINGIPIAGDMGPFLQPFKGNCVQPAELALWV
jgi:hypothetical protein